VKILNKKNIKKKKKVIEVNMKIIMEKFEIRQVMVIKTKIETPIRSMKGIETEIGLENELEVAVDMI